MSIGRNTTYNIIGAGIPIALALVTVPAYLKLIGPDRYGVLAIAWLLLGYFGLFDLGLGRATSQRIAALREATPHERATTFRTALMVNAIMGVVGGLLFWPVTQYLFTAQFKIDEMLRPEILSAVPLLALSVPIATTTGVLTGALQGRERFLEVNQISVASTTLFQLLPLGLAWLYGPSLPMLMAASVFARALALVVLWAKCRAELTRGVPFAVDTAQMGPLLRYGGWVTVTSMFGPMLVIVDRFVIGATIGAVAVAIYTIPFQLAQRLSVIPAALTNALFPRLSSATGDEEDQLSTAAIRTLIATMTPLVIVGLFLFDPFLRLWVGAEMAGKASLVGKVLMVGYWANALALVPYARLQASGRPDLVSKMLLLQVPFYLGLLFVALSYLGLVGAAIVFSVRCAVDYFLLSMASRRIPAIEAILLSTVLLAAALFLSELAVLSPLAKAVAALLLFAVSLAMSVAVAPLALRGRLLGMLARFRPSPSARVGG